MIRRRAAGTGRELREATAVVFHRPLPYLYLAPDTLGAAGIAYQTFDALPLRAGSPTCVIAKTIKGRGVSFMENNPKFHGVAPTKEEVEKAVQEIGA